MVQYLIILMEDMIRRIGFYRPNFYNYNGSALAEQLMANMNDGLFADMRTKFEFTVEYKYIEN